MRVTVQLTETSQPIVYDHAANTYTKGPFYCVYIHEEDKVYKHPVRTIWRVAETYGEHQ